MKSKPLRPISISPETVAKCDGPDQFAAFDRAFRGVIAVPKSAVLKAETKAKRHKARNRKTGKPI